MNSTDGMLGHPPSPGEVVPSIHLRGTSHRAAQWDTCPGLHREFPLSACQANTFASMSLIDFNKGKKKKKRKRPHACPPTQRRRSGNPLFSLCQNLFCWEKLLFTEPPGSLPARVKQRSLENHRTNKPKQPTESKDRKGPQWQMEPTSTQPGCPSPARHSPDDAREDSSVFSLLASASASASVTLKHPSRELVSFFPPTPS